MKKTFIAIVVSAASMFTMSAMASSDHSYNEHSYKEHSYRHEMKLDKIASKLKLNPEQKKKFAELTEAMASQYQTMREARQSMGAKLNEVLGDSFNTTQARQWYDAQVNQLRDSGYKHIDLMAGFYNSLNAEQKKQAKQYLQDMLTRSSKKRWGHHEKHGMDY